MKNEKKLKFTTDTAQFFISINEKVKKKWNKNFLKSSWCSNLINQGQGVEFVLGLPLLILLFKLYYTTPWYNSKDMV